MGFTPKPRGNVVAVFEETKTSPETKTNTTENPWLSVFIFNTGSNALNLIINDLTIPVSANETFDDDFVDFNSIRIAPNVEGQSITYRVFLRG